MKKYLQTLLLLLFLQIAFGQTPASIVQDFTVGANSTNPKSIVVYKNKAYFLVKNATTNIQQLHQSDLTTTGIRLTPNMSNLQIIGNLAVTDSIIEDRFGALDHYNLFFASKRIGPEAEVFELTEFDGTNSSRLRNLNQDLYDTENSPISDVELQTTTQENSNNYPSHINPITRHSDGSSLYSNIGFDNGGQDSLLWSQGLDYDSLTSAELVFQNSRTWFFLRVGRDSSGTFGTDRVRTRDDNAQGTILPENLLPDDIVGIAGGYTDNNGILRSEESKFMFFSKLNGVRRLKAMLYPHGNLNSDIPTEEYDLRESPPLSIDVTQRGIYFQDRVYFIGQNSGLFSCEFTNMTPQLIRNDIFEPTSIGNLTVINGRAFFTATTRPNNGFLNVPNGGIFELVGSSIAVRDVFPVTGRRFERFISVKNFDRANNTVPTYTIAITKDGTTYSFQRIDGRFAPIFGTAQNLDADAGISLINGNTLVFSADNGTTGQELYKLGFTKPRCVEKPFIECRSDTTITVNGTSASVFIMPAQTVSDACNPTSPVGRLDSTFIDQSLSGQRTLGLGRTDVIYSAANVYGASSCTRRYTVVSSTTACTNDVTPPIIRNCPANTTTFSYFNNDNCLFASNAKVLDDFNFNATDNCTAQFNLTHPMTFSPSIVNDCIANNVTYTVTVRARDERGNQSTPCTFQLKYVNLACQVPPIFENCPDDITVAPNNACGFQGDQFFWDDPNLNDQCFRNPRPTVTLSHAKTSCFPLGRTRVTYTATAGGSVRTTCSFYVSVISTACAINRTIPTLATNCPNTITVNTRNDSAAVSWQSPRFTDGSCGVVLVDSTHKSGSKFPKDTTIVTYIGTNSRSITNRCSFLVVVKSCVATINNLPKAICQGDSITVGAKSYKTAGVYHDTLTTTTGCDSIINLTLTVNPLPNAQIAGNNTICTGSSTTLTASGGGTYSWSTNATTATINVNAAGNYIVTITDGNGCKNTVSKTINVNPLPTVNITGATSFCQGGRTTLRASGGLTYRWSNNQTTDVITVTTAATYTVTATDANNCSASTSRIVTVNPLPSPAISGNNSACEGSNITLIASGGTNYVWSNGATTPSVSVNQTGNYFVTVTDANGCLGSTNKNITINPLPNSEITGSSSICTGSSTILTASGGSTYLWSTGETTASITISQANTYTVTVTSAQGCTKTASKVVTVNNTLQPNITGKNAFCAGDSTVLTTSGGTNYAWSNGATTSSITIRQTGTYSVTVTNANGCNGTSSIIVTSNPLPRPLISGSNSICEGSSTVLTASGGTSYRWLDGQTTPSVSVNQLGNYIVTVTDVNGCSASTNKVVTLNPLPTAIISGVLAFCAGSSTTLTASGGLTYLWSTGATSATINPNQAGVYTVTVTDGNGCQNSTSKTLTINPLPTVSISGNLSFCQGGQTTLRASGGVTYRWSNNQTTDVITVTTAATYTVTVTDVNNCSASTSRIVTVNSLPSPTINGNNSACEGSNITLTASSGTSYLWSNGSTTPSVSVNQTGNYFVTVTDANGCSASTNKNITINPLPNAEITGSSSICTGSSTTLTATGGGTYLWSTGATTASITISQANTFTVTVTSAQGCTKTVTKIVTIGNTLQPNITGNTAFCPGDSTVLTTSGGTNYVWSNGSTTPSITVRQAGTYTVTVTNATGCNGSTSIGVTLKPRPIANITPNGPTNICSDKFVRLTASGGISYFWSTTETTPTIFVNRSGNYFVTVTNTEGCQSMASQSVNVSQKPTAKFIANIVGGRVTLTNQTTNGSYYLWKFGVGRDSSVETNPVYNYNANGMYCIRLIAFSADGCLDTAVQCVTITRVATQDLPEGYHIDVSPNPFNELLNIKIALSPNLLTKSTDFIAIYDVLGKRIKQVKLENNLVSIKSSDWLDGVYLVTIIIDNRQYLVTKLVKMSN